MTTADGFVQAMLAGRFLTGDYPALEYHSVNSMGVAACALVLAVASVVTWRIVPLPGWTVLLCVGLFAVVNGQAVLGASSMLAVHVPLGAAIIGSLLALTLWLWKTPLDRLRPSMNRLP
ncbi:hypothetical protein [Nocardia sp. NBC_00403]|uniref:hypothetical protein n=1 Tax=Nocardia sp. NBC_00403 TaxID=2975990 RepID=UPI002E21ED68